MLLSIIIPVYNKSEYIRECLDSVLTQTKKDIEIVCVNDGSTDDSEAIICQYKEKDERVILINQENSGAAIARNNGLKYAKGDYVQFLDADDFFEAEMAECMCNKAAETKADIVICYADKYDMQTGTFSEKAFFRKPLVESDVFNYKNVENIFHVTSSCIWNKIYKKDLLISKSIQFQNLPCNNDTAFAVLTLCLAEKISFVENTFVHYRLDGNTTNISSNRDKHLECSIKANKYIKEELIRRNLYSEFAFYLSELAWGTAVYELSFCKDMQAGKMYIKKMKKLLKEPHSTKLHFYYEKPKAVRFVWLFGVIPLLKLVTLEKTRKMYLFNHILVGVKK